jgi:hypothetical protein
MKEHGKTAYVSRLERMMTELLFSLRETIAGQFHSALKMLDKAIKLCPEALWLAAAGDSPNRTWHIAYHALYYTHFYLSPTDAEFVAWPRHRAEYNYLGEVPLKPGYKPQIDQPYTQAELREYLDFCHEEVDRQIAILDPGAPSGFFWLPFRKLSCSSTTCDIFRITPARSRSAFVRRPALDCPGFAEFRWNLNRRQVGAGSTRAADRRRSSARLCV